MAGLRLDAGRHFGDDRTLLGKRIVEGAILLGVDNVDAAGDDREPVASEPRWAAASMPRAMPEMTAMPSSPSPAARSCASRLPLAEALRAPTTATIGAARTSPLPSSDNTGGASSTAARVPG